MSWGQLTAMQRLLDSRIENRIGETTENLATRKEIAFKVELGELLNEFPQAFKFWKLNVKVDKNKLLEEYVDCLHFALSLWRGEKINEISPLLIGSLQEQAMELFKINITDNWERFFGLFLGLGALLNISVREMQDFYVVKNAVNHSRQASGY